MRGAAAAALGEGSGWQRQPGHAAQDGRPLLRILLRYQKIGAAAKGGGLAGAEPAPVASATETFLRFLSLPKSTAAIVDLRRAAVVIISHLDRLVQPLMPRCLLRGHTPAASSTSAPQQRVYALGWPSLSKDQQGFSAEPSLSRSGESTAVPMLSCRFQIKQVACCETQLLILSQEGKLHTWRLAKPESEPQPLEEVAHETFISIAGHCEGRHFLAIDSNRKWNYYLLWRSSRSFV